MQLKTLLSKTPDGGTPELIPRLCLHELELVQDNTKVNLDPSSLSFPTNASISVNANGQGAEQLAYVFKKFLCKRNG